MEKKKLKSIELFKNNEINNLENITGGLTYWESGITLETSENGRPNFSCEEPGVLGPGKTYGEGYYVISRPD